MSEIVVTENPGVSPETDEGRELFAKLLGPGTTVDDLKFFPHSTPPGHATDRHIHTADVAAYVARGSMNVSVGPKYDHPILVNVGDFLFIPQGLAHREEVIGDEEVVFVVAHRHGFHTLSAD